MSYNGKFHYDVFISYAMADARWAIDFKHELQLLMDDQVSYYAHGQVQLKDPVWKEINTALRNSAVFICIVTPEWLESKLSEQEVKTFQIAASNEGLLPAKGRIFRVTKTPRGANGGGWEDRLLSDTHDFIFFEWSGSNLSNLPTDENFRARIHEVAQEITVALKLLRDSATADPSGTSETFDIIFDPELSGYEIKTAFAALADYYRACGGIGLVIEHELEEVQTQEAVNA